MLCLSLLDFRDDALVLRNAYEMSFDERLEREKRIIRENRKTPLLIIITCTRIEVYSENHPISFESIERAFSLNHILSMDKRHSFFEDDALRHFYSLSLGLDSPLFGEDMILSQISEARGRAVATKGSSAYLMRLSQDVISFSKKMHTEHKIRVFDREIGLFFSDNVRKEERVLIIGSGELARLVAEELVKKGCSVMMTLRDTEKTFLIPPGAVAVPYDERRKLLVGADVIISASSGIYHTLDESDKPFLIGKVVYDLAEPHDIPDELAPLRLKELGIRTPVRDMLIETMKGRIEERIKAFKSDIEMREESLRAEDFSISVLRRLSQTIESLGLDSEKRKDLESAIGECTRKAYIEKERMARRR